MSEEPKLSWQHVERRQEAGFDLASETGGALYRLTPMIVHAWLEGAFEQTQSRWEPPPR